MPFDPGGDDVFKWFGVTAQSSDSQMRERAIELIRDAYEIAAKMKNVDLDAINAPRPAKLRYSSQADLVRDFIDSAGAILDFAGKLGLVNQDEAIAILRETGSAHPELDDWLRT